MDTFRIALAEEQNLLIKEKYSQGHQLSILFFILRHRNLFLFNTRKCTDKVLKNHYTTSNKTSMNRDKNTYEEQDCNQQEIS